MTVFSNPEVIEALEGTVPVAQNVHYTQNRRAEDELSEFFWQVVNQSRHWTRQGVMADVGSTTQGFYIFDAAGRLFGAFNDRSPRRVVRIIEEALAAMAADPPPRLDLGDAPGVIAKPQAPAGAAIARVFTRITPRPAGSSSQNLFIGRDHLWIPREEIAQLARGEFPPELAARLARFHLIDNVRGEPDFWLPEDVKLADFTATRRRTGDRIHVTLRGRFSMDRMAESRDADQGGGRRGRGRPRGLPDTGYDGFFEGELTIDAGGRLLDLKMLAEGTAWGWGRYTGSAPPDPFPLKIAFILVDDAVARAVPPQGLLWGRSTYLNSRLPIGR